MFLKVWCSILLMQILMTLLPYSNMNIVFLYLNMNIFILFGFQVLILENKKMFILVYSEISNFIRLLKTENFVEIFGFSYLNIEYIRYE